MLSKGVKGRDDGLGKSKQKKNSGQQTLIKKDYSTCQKNIYEAKEQVSDIMRQPNPATMIKAHERITELLNLLSYIKSLHKQAINYPNLKHVIINCQAELELKIIETYEILMHKTSSQTKITDLRDRVYLQRQHPNISQYLKTELQRIENVLCEKANKLERKKEKAFRKEKRHVNAAWETFETGLRRATTERGLQSIYFKLEQSLEKYSYPYIDALLNSALNKVQLKLSLIEQVATSQTRESPPTAHAIVGIDNAKAELIPWYNKALDELTRCNYQLHNISRINIAIPFFNRLYPHIEVMFQNHTYAAIITTSTGERIVIKSLKTLPNNNDYLWLLQVAILCHLADFMRKPMEIINTNSASPYPARQARRKKTNMKRVRKAVIVRRPTNNKTLGKPKDMEQKEGILVTGYARRLPKGQKRSIKQSMLFAALTGCDPSVLDQYADGRSRTFVLEHFRKLQNDKEVHIIDIINQTEYTSLAKPVEIYLNSFFEKIT